jgi:prepilin-type N-terminal cleavage/methylation domain-containing protein
MRATSAYFRRASPDCCHLIAAPRGFTLLELLVVLVLLGLVTGLVAPLAVNGLRAARERAVSAELGALLEELPVRAFAAGVAQAFDARTLTRLMGELPPGWEIRVDPVLNYSPSGVASGGEVRLVAPGGLPLRWVVRPVSGEVRLVGVSP